MITIKRGRHTFTRESDRTIATVILGYRMVERVVPSLWHTEEQPDIRRWFELHNPEGEMVGGFPSSIYYDTTDIDTAWSIYCPHFGEAHGDSIFLIAELALRGWELSCGRDGEAHVAVVHPDDSTGYEASGATRALAIKHAVLLTTATEGRGLELVDRRAG